VFDDVILVQGFVLLAHLAMVENHDVLLVAERTHLVGQFVHIHLRVRQRLVFVQPYQLCPLCLLDQVGFLARVTIVDGRFRFVDLNFH